MGNERSLEDRVDYIRAKIDAEEFSVAARESVVLIEFSLRELYRRSVNLIAAPQRTKALKVELAIGEGRGHTFEDFTFGELVRLYRESSFLPAWSESSGTELRALQMINLDEIARLRNKLSHDPDFGANRQEANFLFHVLQIILETFGILSLTNRVGSFAVPDDSISGDRVEGRDAGPDPSTSDKRGRMRRTASSYRTDREGEPDRLAVQADANRAMDLSMIEEAVGGQGIELIALDLGCADGSLTVDRFGQFSSFARVIGVDRDSAAIKRAQLRRSERFDFLEVDLESADFRERVMEYLKNAGLPTQVDLIFSALTVHHLASPIKLLRACRYLLNDRGVVVLRGSDDGTKIAYPDEGGLVQRLIESTLRQPLVSDRENGRKIHSQLRRAGFRQISMRIHSKDTSEMNLEERHNLFLESFSYRRNYLLNRIEAGDPAAEFELSEVDSMLEELELDFEDESFFYLELAFGAIARP